MIEKDKFSNARNYFFIASIMYILGHDKMAPYNLFFFGVGGGRGVTKSQKLTEPIKYTRAKQIHILGSLSVLASGFESFLVRSLFDVSENKFHF